MLSDPLNSSTLTKLIRQLATDPPSRFCNRCTDIHMRQSRIAAADGACAALADRPATPTPGTAAMRRARRRRAPSPPWWGPCLARLHARTHTASFHRHRVLARASRLHERVVSEARGRAAAARKALLSAIAAAQQEHEEAVLNVSLRPAATTDLTASRSPHVAFFATAIRRQPRALGGDTTVEGRACRHSYRVMKRAWTRIYAPQRDHGPRRGCE